MSWGKSLLKVVATAVGQSFLMITECEVASQPEDPLPPKQVRQVSVTLAVPKLSEEPDIPPM